MTGHSIPQTFTVYQNIAILTTKIHDWSPDQAIDRVFTIFVITIFFTKLFTEFFTISSHNHIFYQAIYRVLTISGHNSIFYQIGGQFYVAQDSFQ